MISECNYTLRFYLVILKEYQYYRAKCVIIMVIQSYRTCENVLNFNGDRVVRLIGIIVSHTGIYIHASDFLVLSLLSYAIILCIKLTTLIYM